MFSSISIDARRKSWAMLCGVWSKKPPLSMGTGGSPGPGFCEEQEELDLRVGVEREAQIRRAAQRALEHPARIGVRRRAVGQRDVAEHSRGAVRLAPPRQDLERGRIGRASMAS